MDNEITNIQEGQSILLEKELKMVVEKISKQMEQHGFKNLPFQEGSKWIIPPKFSQQVAEDQDENVSRKDGRSVISIEDDHITIHRYLERDRERVYVWQPKHQLFIDDENKECTIRRFVTRYKRTN